MIFTRQLCRRGRTWKITSRNTLIDNSKRTITFHAHPSSTARVLSVREMEIERNESVLAQARQVQSGERARKIEGWKSVKGIARDATFASARQIRIHWLMYFYSLILSFYLRIPNGEEFRWFAKYLTNSYRQYWSRVPITNRELKKLIYKKICINIYG